MISPAHAPDAQRLAHECIALRQVITRLAAENRAQRQEIATLQQDEARLKERWVQELAERARAFIAAEVGPPPATPPEEGAP